MKKFLFLMAVAMVFAACHQQGPATPAGTSIDYSQLAIPNYSVDSAYQFVADQVAFGYRTPGSVGQQRCAQYLVSQMSRFCDTVIVQDFPANLWDGSKVRGKNIIASIEAREGTNGAKRVLLAAHWDSRMWADHDPDEAMHHHPIDGANDGASGVGVLMELARAVSSQRLGVAVDIIFFDVEDQGTPEWSDSHADNTWCLGSQYWSQHLHVPFYSPVYGILLDMVGTESPRYTKEDVSRQYAPGITNKLWQVAAALGYGNIFVDMDTDPILDDHFYVNRLAGIPMTDIVQNDATNSFFRFWHTMDDTMEHVSKKSLDITLQVLLKTMYGDYGVE